MAEGFLAPRDYRQLLSYRKAEVVFDLTHHFCERFLKRGDRTIDQMVQAARSGKQNIAEGSRAGPTSKESEIKLTNVARASFEELLIDYQDFLRVRGLPLWDKDSREARYVRRLGGSRGREECFETYRVFVETRPAGTVANIAVCLIHQGNYLLDQQLRQLEAEFLEKGGLREAMGRARRQARGDSWQK
jgi:four helix bundle suffix protein